LTTNNKENSIALFDFDMTIVSRDSGYEFVKYRLKSNPIRRIAAIAITPIAMLFYASRRMRLVSHSFYMWIATFGLDADDLIKTRNNFVEFYCSQTGAKAYKEALKTIDHHLESGHKVYIVSGAPEWAIKMISKNFGIKNCEIIGSIEKPLMGGLIYLQHCYGHRKVELLRNIITTNSQKIYGYSDSAADIPLLSICTHKHIINPRKSHLKKFQKIFGENMEVLNWGKNERRVTN